MPNNDEESKFPDEIRAAFESYPQPRTSREFDAQFWKNLDARRGRYRGFAGFLRRLWEIEIEGVAVWPTLGQIVEQCGAAALLGLLMACLCFSLWRLSPSSLPPETFSPSPRLASQTADSGLWKPFGAPNFPVANRDNFGSQFFGSQF
jgi:hypothetical protein